MFGEGGSGSHNLSTALSNPTRTNFSSVEVVETVCAKARAVLPTEETTKVFTLLSIALCTVGGDSSSLKLHVSRNAFL